MYYFFTRCIVFALLGGFLPLYSAHESVGFLVDNVEQLQGVPEGAKEQKEASDLSCAICLNKIRQKLDVITSFPCHKTHTYHYKCIQQWIDRGNKTCPSCKKETASLINYPQLVASLQSELEKNLKENRALKQQLVLKRRQSVPAPSQPAEGNLGRALRRWSLVPMRPFP